MIRVLVVDDEPLARRRLVRLLGEHPDAEVVGEAADGGAAVTETLRLRPDLLLLDVDMPLRSGTEAFARIAEQLPESVRPAVVFTTAHEEHAVEAFALEALDYLVKPVGEEGLARALRRVRRRQWGGDAPTAPEPPPSEPAASTAAHTPTHLVAHEGSRTVRVPMAEVAVVEVVDGQVTARTPDGDHRLSRSLIELESTLPAPPFVRVSRSAILNVEWVEHVEAGFGGAQVARLRAPMTGEVLVARRRVAGLRDALEG